jgi:anionic cell wall polymer biosynthesis LytR-Cps2A-Psr (LCP) family protein
MAERISSSHRLVRALVGVTASVALLVGAGVGVATIQLLRYRNIGTLPDDIDAVPPGAHVHRDACATQACNYLLLGSDSRAGLMPAEEARSATGGTNRADTILLVHTDPRLQKAIVVSFPRDLWVTVPGRGRDRINTAFDGGLAGGGPQRMAQTVANLTRLPIDHFLYVDLNGFRQIVDVLGGVDMCVPKYQINTPGWLPARLPNGEPTQVYYDQVGYIADANAGLLIKPGCQRLEGDQALAYVRARHLPCDTIPDFARIGRQQQFLRAVINQMLQPEMVVRAPSMVRPILSAMRRDRGLRTSDLVYLVGQLRGLSTGAVEFRTVPGTAATIDSKSVLRLDPSAHEIFDAIRQGRPLGRTGARLVDTPPSEANTTVAVVDGASGDTADRVESVLTDAGFDVSPGIWSPGEGGVPGGRAAIVYHPAARARAEVVGAYLPNLPLIAWTTLRGADVAVVVDASYEFVPPGDGSTSPRAAECPSTA